MLLAFLGFEGFYCENGGILWFVRIHMYIFCPGAGAEMHEFKSEFPGILLGSCACARTCARVHECTYTLTLAWRTEDSFKMICLRCHLLPSLLKHGSNWPRTHQGGQVDGPVNPREISACVCLPLAFYLCATVSSFGFCEFWRVNAHYAGPRQALY